MSRFVCLLLVVGCSSSEPGGVPPEQVGPDDSAADTAPPDGVCGDGALDEGEACDEGEANGPDGNCSADCEHNLELRFAIGVDELVLQPRDAVGAVADDAPAGVGAWGAAGIDLNDDGTVKFELAVATAWPNFAPALLDLTLAEVAEISFRTRKSADQDAEDFYLVLYTEADGVDDGASWYGYRLVALPPDARQLEAPAGSWNTWSTAAGRNQLVFGDPAGGVNGHLLPTLGELLDDPAWDWSEAVDGAPQTAIDYGKERVKTITIHSASDEALVGFDGLVDLIRVDRTDGRALVIDLEP